MKRTPFNDFLLIKDKIYEISLRDIEELFKDFSDSLALVENDILTDNTSDSFKEDLGILTVSYLAILAKHYGIDQFFNFLESRSHWGVYSDNYFLNKKESLVYPYYKARITCSNIILKSFNSGVLVKPLFDLTAYLIYLEERD